MHQRRYLLLFMIFFFSFTISNALPDDWYLGCYKDNGTRDLSLQFLYSPNMTVDLCQAFCLDNGTLYFGVQYSTQCYCGNTYGTYGLASPASCDRACAGLWFLNNYFYLSFILMSNMCNCCREYL